jgi:ketosteroid isomerase-like protein
MASNELSQAQANKALVERLYAAAMSGERDAVVALRHEDYTLELNYGHPAAGTFQGKDEIEAGRGKMISLLGISKFWLDEVVAEGPERVVALVGASGTDADGEEWSMAAVELLRVVDGQVVETKLYYRDSAKLRDIALGRESAA